LIDRLRTHALTQVTQVVYCATYGCVVLLFGPLRPIRPVADRFFHGVIRSDQISLRFLLPSRSKIGS